MRSAARGVIIRFVADQFKCSGTARERDWAALRVGSWRASISARSAERVQVELQRAQLASRYRQLNERVLWKRLPATRVEECRDAIDAEHLDAFLVAQRIPEATALPVDFARHTPGLVRRSVDGHWRQLSVRHACLVDQWYGFGSTS